MLCTLVLLHMQCKIIRQFIARKVIRKKNIMTGTSAPVTVKEGKAEVLFPKKDEVFYNPVQEFNRDLSVAALNCHSKLNASTDITPGVQHNEGISILEGLAASGLRSIRYAKEVAGVKRIIANDLSTAAVERISENVKHNNVENIVEPSCSDCGLLMYNHRQRQDKFDAIDLDPYGSPTPFLDAAVQAVKDQGILLITCTDMAVLCGNAFETCYAKYGSVSLKSKSCHEMALRIVLHCLETHANRYGRFITPLLSVSADFYCRLIVRVNTSPLICKTSASKRSMVFQCSGCHTHTFQALVERQETNTGLKYKLPQAPVVAQECAICQKRHHIGGPVWHDPIHDLSFVRSVLEEVTAHPEAYGTHRRLEGLLNVILEELPHAPLYFECGRLSSVVKSTCPSLLQVRSALLNGGYQVSETHCAKNSVKTDAPPSFIWDIFRTWVKDNPIKAKLQEGSVAFNILKTEPSGTVSFNLHPKAPLECKKKGLLRHQVNPERNWGPKMKSRASVNFDDEELKRAKNQGKRRKVEKTE